MRLSITFALLALALAAPGVAQDFSVVKTGPTPKDNARLEPNTTVKLRTSVTNWSTKRVPKTPHGIYLSTDAKITRADRLVRTFETPEMGKLQWIVDLEWTIPNDLPRGWYYLGIFADHLGRVKESDEGNNTGSKRIYLYGRPDLSIPYRTQRASKFARGGRYLVQQPVKNIGGFISKPSKLEIRLSLDSQLTSFDPLLATVNVPALFPDQSVTLSTWITIPTNLRLGPMYLGYWVDRVKYNTLENQRTNNVRTYRVTQYLKGKFWTFGDGCTGQNGKPHQQARATSTDPFAGSSVTYSVTLGRRNTLGLLNLGASRKQWNGIPLPLSLRQVGAPGCTLYASMDAPLPVTTSGLGFASQKITLPRTLTPGSVFYTQFILVDGPANALGHTFSDVIETTVGSYR